MDRSRRLLLFYARVALGTAFLSAVADRFGLWGPPDAANVAWGDMTRFLAYANRLNWFAPPPVAIALGWTATILEIVLGVLLIAGVRLRLTGFAAGLLLAAFALAMSVATGVKTAFDASVYSASAAAFLVSHLAALEGTSLARRSNPRHHC